MHACMVLVENTTIEVDKEQQTAEQDGPKDGSLQPSKVNPSSYCQPSQIGVPTEEMGMRVTQYKNTIIAVYTMC